MGNELLLAPGALVGEGAPRFGTWRGAVGDAAFAGLRGPFAHGAIARKLIEKKWVYSLIANEELFFCLAIIDAGALHSAFLGLFDRRAGKLVADWSTVLPGFFARVSDQPAALDARLTAPGIELSMSSHASEVSIAGHAGGVEVDLQLAPDQEPAPLSACADLGNGRFDFTQKRAGLAARGSLTYSGRSFRLNDAYAGLDFTHGYLRRETAWRWAFGMGEAQGKKLAFNLSDGFVPGGAENVLWLDGAPRPLGPVQFSFDAKDPRAPWTLRGDRVALELTPEGQRAQDIRTPLMSSRYVQPFGSFRGALRVDGEELRLEKIAGVTEDHAAKW